MSNIPAARAVICVLAMLLLVFGLTAGGANSLIHGSSATAAPVPESTPTPSPSPTPDFEHCQISLSASSFVVNENGGQVVIGVKRTCDRVRESKVDFFTQSRSATAGADFTPVSGRLDFANGEINKTITVPIVDDSIAEGNESFTLFLTDPGGSAVLVNPTSAVINIIDNDGTPGPSPTPISSPSPTPSPT